MKRLIIVGGGFAGALIAKKLENSFLVTLLDTKDYFEFTPSVLRTLVEPQHVKRIQVLHSHYLHRAQVIREEVVEISPTTVKTKNQEYGFDYLVICSGSSYNSPIKEKNLVITARASELRQYTQKLLTAKEVLIIGGGLVGVELAAEICTAFPEKKITLVHAQQELLERNPFKARKYAQKFLEKRGAAIIFNELVTEHNNNSYITNKGRKIKMDIAFICTGIIPNYEHLKHCSASLNEKKYLCVNEFLQVKGYDHIFAAGDITAIMEEKTAQNAERQAQVVVENVQRLEQGKSLKHYVSEPRVMVISLGKWDGMLVYKNFVLTGLIPGILKTLIEWKTMGRFR